jgi:hypothetical protein
MLFIAADLHENIAHLSTYLLYKPAALFLHDVKNSLNVFAVQTVWSFSDMSNLFHTPMSRATCAFSIPN